MAFFAVIGVKEFITNGLTAQSTVLCLIAALLLLAEYMFLHAKYAEGTSEKLKNASEALKEIKAPLGFLGGMTTILAILFLLCSILSILTTKLLTLPGIVTTIITVVNYLVIILLPYSFVVGMLEGKYGKGTDFMVYTIGLLVYFAQNYIINSSMNAFVCSQIILAVLMWDAVSTLQLTEEPPKKEKKEKKPKEKKEKVSKKDKKAKDEVANSEEEAANAAVLEAVKKEAEASGETPAE